MNFSVSDWLSQRAAHTAFNQLYVYRTVIKRSASDRLGESMLYGSSRTFPGFYHLVWFLGICHEIFFSCYSYPGHSHFSVYMTCFWRESIEKLSANKLTYLLDDNPVGHWLLSYIYIYIERERERERGRERERERERQRERERERGREGERERERERKGERERERLKHQLIPSLSEKWAEDFV